MPLLTNVYDATRFVSDQRGSEPKLGSATTLGPLKDYEFTGQYYFQAANFLADSNSPRPNTLYRFSCELSDVAGALLRLLDGPRLNYYWKKSLINGRLSNLIYTTANAGFSLEADTNVFSGNVKNLVWCRVQEEYGTVLVEEQCWCGNTFIVCQNRLPILGRTIKVDFYMVQQGGLNVRVCDSDTDGVNIKLLASGTGQKTVTYTATSNWITMGSDGALFTGSIYNLTYTILG